MHFALVASDTDEELHGRWDPVAVGSIVTATRSEPPQNRGALKLEHALLAWGSSGPARALPPTRRRLSRRPPGPGGPRGAAARRRLPRRPGGAARGTGRRDGRRAVVALVLPASREEVRRSSEPISARSSAETRRRSGRCSPAARPATSGRGSGGAFGRSTTRASRSMRSRATTTSASSPYDVASGELRAKVRMLEGELLVEVQVRLQRMGSRVCSARGLGAARCAGTGRAGRGRLRASTRTTRRGRSRSPGFAAERLSTRASLVGGDRAGLRVAPPSEDPAVGLACACPVGFLLERSAEVCAARTWSRVEVRISHSAAARRRCSMPRRHGRRAGRRDRHPPRGCRRVPPSS